MANYIIIGLMKSEPYLVEIQYLPCIQYCSKFLLHEKVFLSAGENYQKRSYRNRCQLATSHGPSTLSIPLLSGKNQQMPIREVKMANEENWKKIHWRTIYSAYKNAPFFDHYAPIFEKHFARDESHLWNFLEGLLSDLLSCWGLSIPIAFDAFPSLWSKPAVDSPNNHNKEWGAFYDGRNSIKPVGLPIPDPRFKIIPYPQVFMEKTGFLPNLTALDLLFCTGPEGRSILENSIA